MLTENVINQFCQEVYPNAKLSTVRQIHAVLNRVNKYEEKLDKSVCLFTLEEYKELFNRNRWTVGRSTFSRNKSLIMAFMRWSQQKTGDFYHFELKDLSVDQLNKSAGYELRYFKSEENFLAALNEAFGDQSRIREKTLCVLYWAGVTREEVLNLKKCDIDLDSRTILKRYKLSDKLFEIVEECVNVNQYYVYEIGRDGEKNKKAKLYLLGKSEYLLNQAILFKADGSSEVPAGEEAKISEFTLNKFSNTINKCFASLSPESEFFKMMPRQSVLNLNGLFVSLYALEKQGVNIVSGLASYKRQGKENIYIEKNGIILDMLRLHHIALTPNRVDETIQKYFDWRRYFFNA